MQVANSCYSKSHMWKPKHKWATNGEGVRDFILRSDFFLCHWAKQQNIGGKLAILAPTKGGKGQNGTQRETIKSPKTHQSNLENG